MDDKLETEARSISVEKIHFPSLVSEWSCSSTITEAGQQCVFPFIRNGVTYSECTYVNDPKAWCPQVTQVTQTSPWGHCADCPIKPTSRKKRTSGTGISSGILKRYHVALEVLIAVSDSNKVEHSTHMDMMLNPDKVTQYKLDVMRTENDIRAEQDRSCHLCRTFKRKSEKKFYKCLLIPSVH